MSFILRDSEVEKRFNICLDCDKLKKGERTKFYKCTECGCYMRAKTKIKGASCPIGKW